MILLSLWKKCNMRKFRATLRAHRVFVEDSGAQACQAKIICVAGEGVSPPLSVFFG